MGSRSLLGAVSSNAVPVAGFDHRELGTSAAEWAASGLLQQARALDTADLRRLIVVAAHPDDESLGAGGLIAQAAHSGAAVTVVIATAGEASHPQSPTVRPAALAAIRRAEVTAAIAVLAPTAQVHQLDLGDGRLGGSVPALVDEILSAVGDSVEGTWLVAPWREDRHPDHAAASAAARQVATLTGCVLLEYPLWAWHWARPGDGTLRAEMLTAVDLSASARAAKDSALAEHLSQIHPLSAEPGDEAIVPPGFRDHFRGTREIFVEVVPDRPAGARP
jgi:LmbE family N-acetylglucosaminyl deacetylase